MNDKRELSEDLRSALDQWAEENLRAIGILKDKIADYDKWKERTIYQLRSIYSDKAIELFLKPKDKRQIDSPDCSAKVNGPDGHTMEIFLKINNGKIIDSSFLTDGCKGYLASAGMVVETIRGEAIEKIKELSWRDISDALGGLPKENEHCALLAVNTLKEALKDLE